MTGGAGGSNLLDFHPGWITVKLNFVGKFWGPHCVYFNRLESFSLVFSPWGFDPYDQIDRILKSLGNLFSFKTSAMTAPNACTKSQQNEAEDPSESRICADQWELTNQIQSKYDLYISAHSKQNFVNISENPWKY